MVTVAEQTVLGPGLRRGPPVQRTDDPIPGRPALPCRRSERESGRVASPTLSAHSSCFGPGSLCRSELRTHPAPYPAALLLVEQPGQCSVRGTPVSVCVQERVRRHVHERAHVHTCSHVYHAHVHVCTYLCVYAYT